MVVLNILNNALPITTEGIKTEDIDRCHPIGKPNKKQNRQVIVKFTSYKSKAKAYDARFNLSNVYMTEDFTATNQTVVNQLIQLKKAKRIKKFWSNDGKIFAKVTDEQPKFQIKTIGDIADMFKNALQEGYADDYETEVAIQEPGEAMDANADESTSIS